MHGFREKDEGTTWSKQMGKVISKEKTCDDLFEARIVDVPIERASDAKVSNVMKKKKTKLVSLLYYVSKISWKVEK